MQKNKALKVLGNLDMVFAGVLMVGLIVLTFVGVIRRYFLRDPITWMEEVQMLLFLWVVFLGGSAAFRTGRISPLKLWWMLCPRRSEASLSGSMYCWNC